MMCLLLGAPPWKHGVKEEPQTTGEEEVNAMTIVVSKIETMEVQLTGGSTSD
jgi:hypothetical protein